MRISTLLAAGVVVACTSLLASPATAHTTVATTNHNGVGLLGSILMLAVALPPPAEASSAPCPICNVGTKGDSQLCKFEPNTALCLGCPTILNVTTINCNARVGAGEYSWNLNQQCSTLVNDNNNCGACGNKCQLTTPVCAGTKCNCTATSCESGSYCDVITTGSCKTCGAGTARCNPFHSYGSQSDCSTLTASDPFNCGSCYNMCGTGEVCSGGVCMCGNSPSCHSSGKVCVGATDATKSCQTCDSPTDDSCPNSQYCTLGHQCTQCPAGTGDCNPFGDTGVDGDCESNLLLSGDTRNCGSCGVKAQLHSAITCCKGVPKCGRFANITSPSDADCNAATACGYDEFCDESLAMCLKIKYDTYDQRGNCDGLAISYNGGQSLTTPQYCTSCNQTISKAALNGSTNCYMFDSQNCGAVGNNCSTTELCYMGQCICSAVYIGEWLSYNPYDVVNPNMNVQMFAEKGCTNGDPKLQLFNGWQHKVSDAVQGFFVCAELASAVPNVANSTKTALHAFTFANMSDPAFRALACPGGPNLCNSTFCDTLIANITAFKTPFCNSLTNLIPFYAYCAVNFLSPDFPKGDPSCARADVQSMITIENYASWGAVKNAVLIGCPGLESFTATGIVSPTGVLSNFLEATQHMYTLGGTFYPKPFNSASGLGASMIVSVAVGIMMAGGMV